MKNLSFITTFAIVTMALMISACGGTKSPADIEMSIWKQVERGNYEKAMKIFYDNANIDETRRNEEAEEQMAVLAEKMRSSYNEKGGIKSAQLQNEEFNDEGNAAKVTVLLTFGDGSTDETSSIYKKVDGVWKISTDVK